MTPFYPKPSMHDVVIGKFASNSADTTNGVNEADWGVTTAILNGEEECGTGTESQASTDRGDYYRSFMLDLSSEISAT